MFVSMKEMLKKTRKGQAALGAFHALNLEQVQGILEAAVMEQVPVIIALDESAAFYAGLGAFHSMAYELASELPMPVSVLLDHVHDLDLIRRALSKGCSGILADVRGDAIGDAVKKLMNIRELCVKHGAFLEVGIASVRDGAARILEDAARLAREVTPDSICISVSPDEKGTPSDDLFGLIDKVSGVTGCPVSLAGAGRWKKSDISRAVGLGVWKISVGTRTNLAFRDGLKSYLDSFPDRIHPRTYLGAARDSFREGVVSCIRLFSE